MLILVPSGLVKFEPVLDRSYHGVDMSDRSIRPIDMGDFQGSAQ